MRFIKDTNGVPSVTLTMLIISFVLCLLLITLNATGTVKNTSSCMELLYACAALYFGRRNLTIGNQTFSSNENKEG